MYISLIWAKLPEINMMDGWMDGRTELSHSCLSLCDH